MSDRSRTCPAQPPALSSHANGSDEPKTIIEPGHDFAMKILEVGGIGENGACQHEREASLACCFRGKMKPLFGADPAECHRVIPLPEITLVEVPGNPIFDHRDHVCSRRAFTHLRFRDTLQPGVCPPLEDLFGIPGGRQMKRGKSGHSRGRQILVEIYAMVVHQINRLRLAYVPYL